MSLAARLGSLGRQFGQRLRGFRERLGLSTAGWWALAAAVLLLGGTATVLGGVSEDVTQHNGLATHDLSNLTFFTDHRPDIVVRAARTVSQFGSVAVLALISIGVGLLLLRRGLPIALAGAPAFSLGVAALLAGVGKQLVDRGRPPAAVRLVTENEPSFPSGHATDSAAMYVTLGLVVAVFIFRRPLLRVALAGSVGLLVAAIGLSRLVLGVHWPTDVLAGFALGGSIALAVTITATLVTRLMPTDQAPPQGRLRRICIRAGRLLVWARPSGKRIHGLRAA